MSDIYRTISGLSEGSYKEKGSKFLAFSIPVQNAEELNSIVKDYKKKYYDARHVCYAFVLGADKKEWRANDDGEPSGTAGRPIHGQIISRDLTNILVIVVRYFGGVLLGTGGLTTAYKEAAADALNQAEIIEKTIDENISIHFEYLLMNDVMKIIKDTNAFIINQISDNQCIMQLSIRKQNVSDLKSKLEKVIGLTFEN